MRNVGTWSAALARMASSGAIERGLTIAELRRAEERFGVRFPPDLAELLGEGLPVGPGFPDWRTLDASIEHQLAGPLEGILFDVEHNAFWLPEWGARPAALDEATVIAAAAVRAAPALVPVAGHRYLPAEPLEAGNPVFSVVQTDIIYYGHDLASYVEAEWGAGYVASISFDAIRPIRFWSRLEERNR